MTDWEYFFQEHGERRILDEYYEDAGPSGFCTVEEMFQMFRRRLAAEIATAAADAAKDDIT